MQTVYVLHVDNHLWGIYSTMSKAQEAASAGIQEDEATIFQAKYINKDTFKYITDISIWLITTQLIEVDL